jgi:hypothetical protein
MLGMDQDEVARSSGERVAQVMKGATSQAIPVGAMTTVGTRSPSIVSALDADLGLGQVLDSVDPLGGIGTVFAGSRHS